jgi:hypothetical protein
MKKIIGVLGVAVIAATMFFSANVENGSTSDASLASLLGMNSANAEWQDGGGEKCKCTNISSDVCYYSFTSVTYCYPSIETNDCK